MILDTLKYFWKFKSQAGQDKWVAEFYKYKKNGYFVDIGAYDGVYYSNSYFFEKYLGWQGLLVEADPELYKNLVTHRSATAVNVAVSDHKGEANFMPSDVTGTLKVGDEGIKVKVNTLDNIFAEQKVPKKIDYLSIDIEGSEILALSGLDFRNYDIGLITIEHNLYLGSSTNKDKIFKILTAAKFTRVKEDISHKGFPFEDWYVNNKLLK